jgi:hypothetical protein
MSKLKDYLIMREHYQVDARIAEIESTIRDHNKQRQLEQVLGVYNEYEASVRHRDQPKA